MQRCDIPLLYLRVSPGTPVGCPLIGLHGGWGARRRIRFYSMKHKTNPLPSSARKRRCDRTVYLHIFFLREEVRPRKPRFVLMSCNETEKTFKCVSAVRLAQAIEDSFGKLQAVVRQRNGTIFLKRAPTSRETRS